MEEIDKIYVFRAFEKTDILHVQEFLKCIDDLIENKQLQNLSNFLHHYRTTRLHHCLGVSYYSYTLARKFGLDYNAVARGALLHDFYEDTLEWSR